MDKFRNVHIESRFLITPKTIKYKENVYLSTYKFPLNIMWLTLKSPPPKGQQPLLGQGLLIIEASRLYSDTLHSLGLVWASDQHVAETFLLYNTQHSQETDIHVPGGIRTRNANKRAAAEPCLRPRAYLDLPHAKDGNKNAYSL
jgi:hypothetical protein